MSLARVKNPRHDAWLALQVLIAGINMRPRQSELSRWCLNIEMFRDLTYLLRFTVNGPCCRGYASQLKFCECVHCTTAVPQSDSCV